MNKLSAYVIRTAFLSMLAGVLGLWLLQIVFSYLSELENLSDSYTLTQAFWYILYRAPEFLVEFTPTGVLLGAVVGLGLLSANSEIVVMRASGISLYRIIGWTMLPAWVFVLASLSVNQWVLPVGVDKARQIKDPHQQILAINGYWSVIPEQTGKRIVYIEWADSDGNLKNIKQYQVNDDKLMSAMSAKAGVFDGGADGYTWTLQDAHQVNLGNSATNDSQDKLQLSLPISQKSVALLTKDPQDLSISQLYAHKQLMIHQQSRSKTHELAFWQKLLSPFSVLSLLLIACSFVFGSLRSQSLGFRVVIALLTGLLFSYLMDLSGFIALATSLSPLVMVLLPIVISALIGAFLLNQKR